MIIQTIKEKTLSFFGVTASVLLGFFLLAINTSWWSLLFKNKQSVITEIENIETGLTSNLGYMPIYSGWKNTIAVFNGFDFALLLTCLFITTGLFGYLIYKLVNRIFCNKQEKEIFLICTLGNTAITNKELLSELESQNLRNKTWKTISYFVIAMILYLIMSDTQLLPAISLLFYKPVFAILSIFVFLYSLWILIQIIEILTLCISNLYNKLFNKDRNNKAKTSKVISI